MSNYFLFRQQRGLCVHKSEFFITLKAIIVNIEKNTIIGDCVHKVMLNLKKIECPHFSRWLFFQELSLLCPSDVYSVA